MSRVSDEFQTISDDGSTKVVYFDGKTYLPRAIPVQILDYYHNRFGKSGRVLSDYYEDEAGNVADCTLSAIANNVANDMISTIELEKYLLEILLIISGNTTERFSISLLLMVVLRK